MKGILFLSLVTLAGAKDLIRPIENLLAYLDDDIDNTPLEHKPLNKNLSHDYIGTPEPPISVSDSRMMQNIEVPDSICVTIKAHYNYPFKRFVENNKELKRRGLNDPKLVIKRIIKKANEIYRYPGLDMRVKLQLKVEPIYVSAYVADNWKADRQPVEWLDHYSIRNRLDGSADHFAFFAHTNIYHGTVGVAYLRSVCGDSTRRNSITEFTNTIAITGETFAHEVGHALGMLHAWKPREPNGEHCEGENGVMDYHNTPDKWTSCSKNDFAKYWNYVGRRVPNCLSASRCLDATNRDNTVTSDVPDQMSTPSGCFDDEICMPSFDFCGYKAYAEACPKSCGLC